MWKALTDARELERWFPLDARVDPGEGGSIWMSWRNEFAAASTILEWDPPHLLRTSWEFGVEGQAQVTDYLLEASGGGTRMRVVTSGFPADATWDDWVEGTRLGWRFELRSLKHYLERHAGRDRGVVYLRRRVGLSREDAWRRLFGTDGFGVRPLGGEPFDQSAPWQYAALVDDPAGGMLRITVEPSYAGVDARDVTLWLSAWGGAAGDLRTLESGWTSLLTRLFPDGEALEPRPPR